MQDILKINSLNIWLIKVENLFKKKSQRKFTERTGKIMTGKMVKKNI